MNGSTAKGNARCTSGCGLWGETALAYSDKRHAALIWNERFIGNKLRLIRGEPVSRALFEVFNLVYQSTTPRKILAAMKPAYFLSILQLSEDNRVI